jgi:hypothetical protein
MLRTALSTIRTALLALTAVLLTGCGHVIHPELAPNYGKRFDFQRPPCRLSPQPVLKDDEVGLRYFGTGGLYIEWRGAALLMAPYFTNPGTFRVLRGPLESDLHDIEYGLSGMDLSRVRAIAAGHSHYDHIGDLPVLAARYVPEAPVYVNQTGANALASTSIASARIHPLEKETDWIRLRTGDTQLPIRFRKVPTEHAPHFWGIHLGKGPIDDPWTKPWKDHHFLSLKEGTPYAFVIELLSRNNSPLFRIYYEDSANPRGKGVPDVTGTYDLAVLVMASFRFVREHPEFILGKLKPRHVLVTHYESFFQDRSEPVRFVFPLANSEANRFLRRTRDALHDLPTQGPEGRVCGPSSSGWTMPMPGEWVRFRVQSD